MQSQAQLQRTAFIVILLQLTQTVVGTSDTELSSRTIPSVIHEGPPQHIFFKAGDRIVLPCRASGFPKPRFYWYFNGVLLETSNETSSALYVRNSSESGCLHLKTWASVSQGYYQCFAVNVAGASLSNISFVQEAVFEDVNFRRKVINITAREAGYLTVPCNHHKSIPPASITWLVTDFSQGNRQPVFKRNLLNERIIMDDFGNLTFTLITKHDACEQFVYECHAYNYITGQTSTGSYFRIILLPEQVKKSSVPELIFSTHDLIAVNGTDVSLLCLFSSRLTSKTKWHRKDGLPLSASAAFANDHQRLMLKHVTWEDSGVYICTGFNDFGEIKAPIKVTVVDLVCFGMAMTNCRSGAPQVKRHLESQIVTSGSSVSFTCSAENQDKMTIQWFLNSQRIYNLTAVQRNWTTEGDNLTLSVVGQNDTGSYSCNISSNYGSIIQNAYLAVIAPHDELFESDGEDNRSVALSSNLCSSSSCDIKIASSSLLKDLDDFQQSSTRSVQPGTSEFVTDILSTSAVDDVSYLKKYGADLYVQDQSQETNEDSNPWKFDLFSFIWICVPIAFFALLFSLTYHRMKTRKMSYKVHKQEKRRGCYTMDYNSDDSGYGEQKTEPSTGKRYAVNSVVPDLECYL